MRWKKKEIKDKEDIQININGDASPAEIKKLKEEEEKRRVEAELKKKRKAYKKQTESLTNIENNVMETELVFNNEVDGLLKYPNSLYKLNPKLILFHGKSGSGKSTAARLVSKNYWWWKQTTYDNFNLEFDSSSSNSEERAYKGLLSSYVRNYNKEKEEAIKEFGIDPKDFKSKEKVVFILDEADTKLPKRMMEGQSNTFRNDKTNAFLKFYDELPDNAVIILTTNYVENIDSAALRRVDLTIEFKGEYDDSYKQSLLKDYLDDLGVSINQVNWEDDLDVIKKKARLTYLQNLAEEGDEDGKQINNKEKL